MGACFIRLAVMDDLSAVEGLDAECFPEGRFDVEPAAAGEIVAGVSSGLVFVAVDSLDGVVGFSQVRLSGEPTVGEILSLGILESWRERGIGSLLLEAAVSKCLAEECSRVMCVTAPSNVAMQSVLRAAGFVEVEVIQDYYGAGKDRVLFELVV